MKPLILLTVLCATCHGQTIQILHIDTAYTNIAGVNYDRVFYEAAPLDTNFSYAWERLSFTQFGQPQWNQVGQMTPTTIAFGSTVYLPSGEANLIRTRKLIPPAK